MQFQARSHHIDLSERPRPLVMGIVNINDDSFSGDGSLEIAALCARARRMIEDGADIIDAGAESARTNREAIPVDEEIARTTSFLNSFHALRAALPKEPSRPGQLWPPLLSINTWRPEVSDAVLESGGEILNDIGALPDDRNARACARHGAALVIMHSVGRPKEPRFEKHYPDIQDTLDAFFTEKIALAEAAGLSREKLILDPGIDFAKQHEDNLRIYRELERLEKFQLPVLLPVSRKTVIGEVLGIEDPARRDAGTMACLVSGALRGAKIFRVHNVRAAVQTLETLAAVENDV